jgi:hypothetical protein
MTLSTVRLHVGQGTHRGPLTVFPVWTDAPSSPADYLAGSDAPVDVAERAGSPAVDQLVVTNRADRPVLLLAGELLEGGMQHRALTATTLLAAGQPTVVQVVCVEQGRWSGGEVHGRRSRRAPLSFFPHLERPEGQQEVWRRVGRLGAVAGPSPTDSLLDRLDATGGHAQRLTAGLRPLAGQRGLLVGIAGRPRGWSCSAQGASWPSTGPGCCTPPPSTPSAGRRPAPPPLSRGPSRSGSRAPSSAARTAPASVAAGRAVDASAWTTSAGPTSGSPS